MVPPCLKKEKKKIPVLPSYTSETADRRNKQATFWHSFWVKNVHLLTYTAFSKIILSPLMKSIRHTRMLKTPSFMQIFNVVIIVQVLSPIMYQQTLRLLINSLGKGAYENSSYQKNNEIKKSSYTTWSCNWTLNSGFTFRSSDRRYRVPQMKGGICPQVTWSNLFTKAFTRRNTTSAFRDL